MVAFPIHGQEPSFREKGGLAIAQMPSAARVIIEGLQPWKANTPANPNAHEANPLFILNRLCNQDKHRHFIFEGAIGTRTAASLGPKSRDVQVAIGQRTGVRYGPFSDQTDVIRLLVRQIGPDPYVDVNHTIHIDPAFPEGGPAGGKIVIDVCADIFSHIASTVIPQLQDFV